MKNILITGNTFPVKEQIKALGGKWNRRSRGWQVPAENADEARDLVENASINDERDSRVDTFYFPATGRTVYQNSNGRCEDAPCCGCCS